MVGIKKKQLIGLIFICIIYSIGLIISNCILWLSIDFMIMLAIILKARISFFSVNAVVSTYPLVAIICEYYFNFSYGLLHLIDMPIHITEISKCIAIFDLCLLYMVFFTDSLEKEKQMMEYIPQKISKLSCEIFAVMSSVFVIIAFPYGFFSFENRQQALLKGQAWMLLALMFLFISLLCFKKSPVIKVCSTFTFIWYFLHAERVEFIGFLIMVVVVLFYRSKARISVKQCIVFAVIAFFIVVIMAFVGNLVRGTSISLGAVFRSVFLQGSMVDMMYVFNTGIDYVDYYGTVKGQTLAVYLDKIFLFADSDRSYTRFLQNYRFNMGGGYAITDGYLNFGYVGVLVQSLIQMIWIRFCLNKKTNYRYFCYCFLFSLCFRYTWYGYYYYEKTPVIYVPAILLMIEVIYYFEKKINGNAVLKKS